MSLTPVFDDSVFDSALFGGAGSDVFDPGVFDLDVLDTGLNGPTLFYVIGLAAGWSDPTALQIRNNQQASGAEALRFGREDSPTSSAIYSFSAPSSGLTPGTSYKVALVWWDGTTYSNIVVGDFTTTNDAGRVKYWNGTAWVLKPLKVWNGTTWVAATLKFYNGTSWVT